MSWMKVAGLEGKVKAGMLEVAVLFCFDLNVLKYWLCWLCSGVDGFKVGMFKLVFKGVM